MIVLQVRLLSLHQHNFFHHEHQVCINTNNKKNKKLQELLRLTTCNESLFNWCKNGREEL